MGAAWGRGMQAGPGICIVRCLQGPKKETHRSIKVRVCVKRTQSTRSCVAVGEVLNLQCAPASPEELATDVNFCYSPPPGFGFCRLAPIGAFLKAALVALLPRDDLGV